MKTAVIAAWLLAEATKMPLSPSPDETSLQVRTRLETIASSLAAAAKDQADGSGWTSTELAAAALVLWNEESRFDARVHAGLPHPVWTQDQGRARCLGQLHQSALVPPDEWARLAGTDEDATLQCGRATIRVLTAQGRRCGVYLGVRADRNRIAQVYAAYGSGGKCRPDDRAWQRADRWLKVMASRPDRSPVKGYRRAMPGEIPASVRAAANRVRDDIGHDAVVGKVYQATAEGQHYALLVEKHAEGKTGVSVLVAE